jgi:hypothetical protein
VTGADGNCPKIVAGQTIYIEQVVGGDEACRRGALHECDREVATNAVTSEHDPRMRRVNSQPLPPRTGAQQRAVVIDQPLLRDDRGSRELWIDPVQLGQQLLFQQVIIGLFDEGVRVQLDNRTTVRRRPAPGTLLEAFEH